MNNHYEISPQIRTLLDHFNDEYSRRNVTLRHEVYSRVLKENSNRTRSYQFGTALRAYLHEREIQVAEYDIFAGQVQYLDYKDSFPVKLADDFDPAIYPRGKFDVKKEVENYLKFNSDANDDTRALLSKAVTGHRTGLYGRWNSGHVLCGYEKLLTMGIPGLIDECRKSLDTCAGENRDTVLGMLQAVKGLEESAKRYAAAAEEAAEKTKSDDYKRNLNRIAETCKKLISSPPKTFYEALQLVVLGLDAIISENISGSISIGRIDQWLYPFYIEETDEEEAPILMDALWIKIAHLIQGYQNVTIGGSKEDGSFAGNILTRMCIWSAYKIRKDQPLLSFRYHKDMTDEYWDDILKLIRTGIGFPALFNDEPITKSKMRAGVKPEDAWRYAIVGCVEPCIERDEYSNTEQMRLNWAMILGIMLSPEKYEIKSSISKDLEAIKTFEEFYAWFKEELLLFADFGVEICNLLDSTYGRTWPAPLISALMDGCIENAKDITCGSVKYCLSSINSCGMADAVDSLLAIRELVFARKYISLKDLGKQIGDNFSEMPMLSQIARNLNNKFGNDSEDSDKIMKDLTDAVSNRIINRTNYWGNHFQVGYYSVDDHATLGAMTGALPDGRLSGTSLANGFSPCQGADINGPTAVINSLTKMDMSTMGNGMVLDLKFNPAFLEKKERQTALRQLIESYFEKGGMEVQLNVIDRETLLNAQAKPEDYRSLIVRVSGFSAYFTTLSRVCQNEIINRTENSRF